MAENKVPFTFCPGEPRFQIVCIYLKAMEIGAGKLKVYDV